MITNAYQELAKGSLFCPLKGYEVYYGYVSEEDKTFCNWISKELGTRLLNLAGAVIGVATLALNLLAMIPFSLLALCFEGPGRSWELFKSGVMLEWMHYAFLPVTILAIFNPQYSHNFN